MPESDDPVRVSRPVVALLAQDIRWEGGSGTHRFAVDLIRGLLALRQDAIDYRVIVAADALPASLKLPAEKCHPVPPPSRGLPARMARRARRLFWNAVDGLLAAAGMKPTLGALGHDWIRRWLDDFPADLFYYPSCWNHELVGRKPLAATIHDMQHLHHPQWWESDRFQRWTVLPWFAEHAAAITCSTLAVADDLVDRLGVPRERAVPIFLGPPSMEEITASDPGQTRVRHRLPDRFMVYPAAVWPHKNHLALVEAIALCRDRGVRAACVCTGETADWLHEGQFDRIRSRIRELDLEDLILFTGSVSNEDLHAIESMADFFIVPTLFEAGSYPVWEACELGKAVACSDVALLPFQIRDAGLLFDPTNVQEMADAIGLLWTREELRAELGRKAARIAVGLRDCGRRTALGYHRLFVNLLVKAGRLGAERRIDGDPAPPLDAGERPPRLDWKKWA